MVLGSRLFHFSLLILSTSLLAQVTSQDGPLVQTSLGDIRGIWMTSQNNKQYAAFMSLPFAKPPLGELRFQPPHKVEPWSGEWDGSEIAPQCLTWDHVMCKVMDQAPVKGYEDCLYLNVYTPKLPGSEDFKEPLDVIVFIHAGAFMFGGSFVFGAKKLMDRDVVFVTINYRLGPLGFLSLEDDVVPGNNGLRDQTMALEWIRDHIANFGGNPNSVTIMGMSAGGSSVHYHYLSPLSQGLFHRGISISGTSLSRWALTKRGVRDISLQLVASLGCPTDQDSNAIVECMRRRPAHRIVAKMKQFQVWQYSPFAPMGPVVEKYDQTIPAFLPDTPINLLKQGKFARLPWVTGVTQSEGLYPVATFINIPEEMAKLNKEFNDLIPHLLHCNRTLVPEVREQTLNAIRKEYFGDAEINENTAQGVVKMTSDRLFNVDAQRAAQLQAQFSDVYFYHFTFKGKHSLSHLMADTNKDYGTSHGDDVSYFSNVVYIPDDVPREGKEKQVEENMLDIWTHFAKYGSYKLSEKVTWTPVSGYKELQYLLIDDESPKMKISDDIGNCKFWENLPITEPEQSYLMATFKEEL